MTQAAADVPAPNLDLERDFDSLLKAHALDMTRALTRARELANLASEAAFDDMLVQALASVPGADGADVGVMAPPIRRAPPPAPRPDTRTQPDTTGKYESPKEVVARLKRAAAKAAADAAAEKAERAADQAGAQTARPAPATDKTTAAKVDQGEPKEKYESPKEVVARLKRSAAKAAKEVEEAARADAARADAARAEQRALADSAGGRDATDNESQEPPAPRRETPKEVVARLKKAAAQAAAREAVRAEADARKADSGKRETPKEVVARLKKAAAEAAAAEHRPDEPAEATAAEPPAAKETPRDVVARLKKAAAQAKFSPSSDADHDVGEIPGVDGIPAGLADVSEPEIRIVTDDGQLPPPAEFTGDDGAEDDLLPAAKRAIPLSELEPLAPIDRRSDPSELADQDFPDIETIDQPGMDADMLSAGAMASLPGEQTDSVFGSDDFDFDSMFDAAVGPAAIRAESDPAINVRAGSSTGEFGLDLLAEDRAATDAATPQRSVDVGDFTVDALADDLAPAKTHLPAADGVSVDLDIPEENSAHRPGPLDAVPAVLISEDSKGLDVDFEINTALESLSGNINVPSARGELDFDIDAAFDSAVAPDLVAADVDRSRAGTSSIEISFSEDEDEDLFNSAGPSGLELALQSDAPVVKRSSQVIAAPGAGEHGHDPTMILDDLESLVTDEPDDIGDESTRDVMAGEFGAGALDAADLQASDLDALSRQKSDSLDETLDNAADSTIDTDGVEIDMVEELALDDDAFLLVEEVAEPSRPPPPPEQRSSAPPPPVPPSFGSDEDRSAAELAASEFGFGSDFGDDDDGPKKKGFFGRLFNKK